MKLTLDVENTVTKRDGKMHLDPFEPENSLTMVGVLTDQGVEQHFPFDHDEHLSKRDYSDRVQWYLDQATIIICHNAAYDLLGFGSLALSMMGLCLTLCLLSMYCSVVSKNRYLFRLAQSVIS